MKTFKDQFLLTSLFCLSVFSLFAQPSCPPIEDPLMAYDFDLLIDPDNCCQEIVGSYSNVYYSFDEAAVENECGACDYQTNPYTLRTFIYPNPSPNPPQSLTWNGSIDFCGYIKLADILNDILLTAGVNVTFMANAQGIWAEDVDPGFGIIDFCVAGDCTEPFNSTPQNLSSTSFLPCTHNIIDPEYKTWDITQDCESFTGPQITLAELGENAPVPQDDITFFQIDGDDFTTSDITSGWNFDPIDSVDTNVPSANAVGNLFNAIAATDAIQNGIGCTNINCYDLSALATQMNEGDMATNINDNMALQNQGAPPSGSSWSEYLSGQVATELANLNLAELLNENLGLNIPNVECEQIIPLPYPTEGFGDGPSSNLNEDGKENGLQSMMSSMGTETEADPNFFAQTVPGLGMDGPGAAAPSPSALSMIENIKGGVNLYNGSQSTSIPLYTVQANDISIPISLSSSNNGLKVNDLGSVLGQNWNLDAGGMITRVVKGLPDEYNGTVTGNGRGRVYKLTPLFEIPSNFGIDVNFPLLPDICQFSVKKRIKYGFEKKLVEASRVKVFLAWTPLRGNKLNLTISIQIFPFVGPATVVQVMLNVGFSIGINVSEVLGDIEYHEDGLGFFHLDDQPGVTEASLDGLDPETQKDVLNAVHPNKKHENLEFFSDQIANWNNWIEALTGNHIYNTQRLDTQPDEFHFSVGGYSGRFSYNLDEVPVIFPYQEGLSITKYPENGGGDITGFKIITPDGKEYTFGDIDGGGEPYAVDFTENTNYNLSNYYTYPEIGKDRDNFDGAQIDVAQLSYLPFIGKRIISTYGNTYDRNYRQMPAPRFSSSWHLVKVKSLLSQEEIDLVYEQSSAEPLVYYADKSYSHSFPNFEVTADKLITNPNILGMNPIHNNSTRWENGKAEFAYSVTETALERWDLKSINTNRGESAFFEYETPRGEIDGDNLCDKILIRRSGAVFKGWKFTYDTETAPGGGSSTCNEVTSEAQGTQTVMPGDMIFKLGNKYDLQQHEFNNYLHINFRISCLTIPFRLNLGFLAHEMDWGYTNELAEFGSLMDVKRRLGIFDQLKEDAVYNAEFQRSFLTKIEEIDKNEGLHDDFVNISYVEGTPPKRFSIDQDLLGYYNSNTTGSPLPPIKYEYIGGNGSIVNSETAGVEQLFGFYNVGFEANFHRGHYFIGDFARASIGALESLKYGSGGEISYTYESNILPFDGSEEDGAGIRVSSLKENPFDNPSKVTSYIYSGPRVINDPIRIEQNPNNFYYPLLEQRIVCSSAPINPMFSNKSNHVGYERVTEYYNGGFLNGSVAHHFTTPVDFENHINGMGANEVGNGVYWDHMEGMGSPENDFTFTAGDNNLPASLDFPEEMFHIGAFMGLEHKTEVFDALGTLLQQTDNDYEYYGTECVCEKDTIPPPDTFNGNTSSKSMDDVSGCSPGLIYFASSRYQYNYPGDWEDIFKSRLIQNLRPYKDTQGDFDLNLIIDLIDFLRNLIVDGLMATDHPFRYVDRYSYVSQRCINSGNARMKTSVTFNDFENGSSNSVTSNYTYFGALPNIPSETHTYTSDNKHTYSKNIFIDYENSTVPYYHQSATDYLVSIGYKMPAYSYSYQSGILNKVSASITALTMDNDKVVPWSNYTIRNNQSFAGNIELAGVFDGYNADGKPDNYYLAKHGASQNSPLNNQYFFDPIEFTWNDKLQITNRTYSSFSTDYEYDLTYFVLKKVTDPDLIVTEYDYDERWRLLQTKTNNGIQVTDYEYNIAEGDNWMKSTLSFHGSNPPPDQPITQYSDGFGRSMKTVRENDEAVLTSTKFDNMFRVNRSYTIGRGMTTFTYDYNPLNRKTTSEDAEGNKTVTINSGDSGNFTKTEVTDPNEHTLTTWADGFGRTVKRTSGEGGTTEYSFNDINQLLQIENPDGELYNYTYNNIGRVATKEIPGAGTKSIVWDVAFRPVATQDAEGNAQVMEYDEYNRLTTVKENTGGVGDPSTAVPEGSISGNQLLLSNNYVTNHTWLASSTVTILLPNNGFGGTKTTIYSNHNPDFGHPTGVDVIYPDGSFSTTIDYNDAALVTMKTNVFNGPSNYDYRLFYEFDDVLRPTDTNMDFDGTLQRINKLFYNGVDQIIKKHLGGTFTGPPLQSVNYRYDGIGRLTHINSPSEMECLVEEEVCDMNTLLVIYPSRSSPLSNCQFLYSIKIDGEDYLLPSPLDLYNNPNDLQGAVKDALDALGYQGDVTVDVNPGGGPGPFPGEGAVVISLNISQTNAQEIILEYGTCTPSTTLNTRNCCESEPIPTDNPDGLPQDYTDLYYQYNEYTGLDINRIEIGSDCNTGLLRNDYTYDADHRITIMKNTLFGAITHEGAYNTEYGYTAAGNIESLKRSGFVGMDGANPPNPTFDMIDELTYSYDPNQASKLDKVEDNPALTHQPRGFFPLTSDYLYDNNGNLTYDGGKGLTIEYNLLNLPSKVDGVGGDNVTYEYTFGGEKTKKIGAVTPDPAVTRLYLGGFEFVDNQPEAFNHGEGRIILTGVKPRFQFKIADHLGNTVVLFEDKDLDGTISTAIPQDPEDAEVVQRNLYYPFGLALQGTWDDITDPRMDYLYNGKEFEEELGLNWLSYGARMYDPAIGRFPSVDPLADSYASFSPYNYVYNNPIGFIDPDGRSGVPIIEGNVLTIKSHFYIYGGQALQYTDRVMRDIATRWNEGDFVRNVNGIEYKIQFEISYEVVTEDHARHLASENKSPLNNFLRIEDSAGPSSTSPGKHGGNSFYLATDQLGEGSSTAAHEYGHGLGMLFHDGSGEFVKGQPGIMTSIHTGVEAQYTQNPENGDSKIGPKEGNKYNIENPLNTDNRKVTQNDINRIYIDNNPIKPKAGDVTNYIFNSSGK